MAVYALKAERSQAMERAIKRRKQLESQPRSYASVLSFCRSVVLVQLD